MHPSLFLNVSPLIWPLGPTVLLGLAAVCLLLPRPRPYPAWWGGLAGGAALLLSGVFLIRGTAVSPESVLFYAFSAIAVVAAVFVITQRNPARAALSFALVVLSTCGLFLLRAAPFLAAATTIVYAGAIIVTFLFVLMLAQQSGRSDADHRSREPFLASAAGFVLLGSLLYVLQLTYATPQLDELIERAERAARQPTEPDLLRTLGDGERADEQFFAELDEAIRRIRGARELQDLWQNRLFEIQTMHWLEARRASPAQRAQEMSRVLREVAQLARRAQRLAGRLDPPSERLLSAFSGPPPARVTSLDAQGNAPLPAENTAFLGRALFTDYLLAVELGGILLLVATIGAIVIASRRAEARSAAR